MTAEVFAEQLDDLMDRALRDAPAPVARMVYELEMAKNRMVRLQLAIEQRMEMQAAAKAILPANGNLKLPPMPGVG